MAFFKDLFKDLKENAMGISSEQYPTVGKLDDAVSNYSPDSVFGMPTEEKVTFKKGGKVKGGKVKNYTSKAKPC